MNKQLTRRQRLSFFLTNFIAFALIFLSLGLILLQLLNFSAYQETDRSLSEMAQGDFAIEQEIQRYQGQSDKNEPPEINPNSEENQITSRPPTASSNRFNTQIILWSKAGDILNTATLGSLSSQLSELSLDTDDLGKVEEVSMSNSEETLNFHSITLNYADDVNDIAYVQVLANVNQIEHSLKTSRTIVMLSMIGFWLLSILVSYILSSFSMRPLLKAWDKQQEFVANASHELRTPLAIIQNDLEKLFRHPDQTILDQSETIAQAMKETRRLRGLTDDLLTIARGDSNRLVLNKVALDPTIFLTELVTPFREMAELDEKQFTLEMKGQGTILVDQKQMHQVLVILLDNALKYTQAGNRITVLSKLTDKKWELHVQNTGPSISPEDQAFIFDRFYREDKSRAKETGGYGLGLAIAKQIVTEHGGTLFIQELVPHGVDFVLQLKRTK